MKTNFYFSGLLFVALFSCDSKNSTVDQENVTDSLESVIPPKSDTITVAKIDSVPKNQEKEENSKIVPIEIEGTITSELLYDGISSIELSLIKSSIDGNQKLIKLPKTLTIYFQTDFNDKFAIQYKGNFENIGDGGNIGKKVKGIICESLGEFENKENGRMEKSVVYRALKLNYMD